MPTAAAAHWHTQARRTVPDGDAMERASGTSVLLLRYLYFGTSTPERYHHLASDTQHVTRGTWRGNAEPLECSRCLGQACQGVNLLLSDDGIFACARSFRMEQYFDTQAPMQDIYRTTTHCGWPAALLLYCLEINSAYPSM